MDALLIPEANDIAYKAQNEGMMHACRPRVRTASLIGVAEQLKVLKQEYQGTMKLVFHPPQPKIPGAPYL